MPIRIKKKPFKKKIKEPDKFVILSQKVLSFAKENSKAIFVVSLALIIIIASSGIFITRYKAQKEDFFLGMYDDIINANKNYAEGNYNEAQKIFEKVIQESEKSSLFNDIALVGLGYTLIDKGDYDRSISLIEDLVSREKLQHPKEELYKNLLFLYRKTGAEAKAKETHDKLMALFPGSDINLNDSQLFKAIELKKSHN